MRVLSPIFDRSSKKEPLLETSEWYIERFLDLKKKIYIITSNKSRFFNEKTNYKPNIK